jgi:hypothetical protein
MLAFGGLVAAIIIDSKPATSTATLSTNKVGNAATVTPVIYGSTAVTNYPSPVGVPPIDITPFPNPITEATSVAPPTGQTIPAIAVPPIIDNKAYTSVKKPSLVSSPQKKPQTSVKSLSTTG